MNFSKERCHYCGRLVWCDGMYLDDHKCVLGVSFKHIVHSKYDLIYRIVGIPQKIFNRIFGE